MSDQRTPLILLECTTQHECACAAATSRITHQGGHYIGTTLHTRRRSSASRTQARWCDSSVPRSPSTSHPCATLPVPAPGPARGMPQAYPGRPSGGFVPKGTHPSWVVNGEALTFSAVTLRVPRLLISEVA